MERDRKNIIIIIDVIIIYYLWRLERRGTIDAVNCVVKVGNTDSKAKKQQQNRLFLIRCSVTQVNIV